MDIDAKSDRCLKYFRNLSLKRSPRRILVLFLFLDDYCYIYPIRLLEERLFHGSFGRHGMVGQRETLCFGKTARTFRVL